VGTYVSPLLYRMKAPQNQDDFAATTTVKSDYPAERPAEVQAQKGVGVRRTQFIFTCCNCYVLRILFVRTERHKRASLFRFHTALERSFGS